MRSHCATPSASARDYAQQSPGKNTTKAQEGGLTTRTDKPCWTCRNVKHWKGGTMIFTLFMYDSEVRSGGIHQYLFNSSGAKAHDCVWALRTVGAEDGARSLEEAMAMFPGGHVPEDLQERRRVCDFAAAQKARLNELADRYYEYAPDPIVLLCRHFANTSKNSRLED